MLICQYADVGIKQKRKFNISKLKDNGKLAYQQITTLSLDDVFPPLKIARLFNHAAHVGFHFIDLVVADKR